MGEWTHVLGIEGSRALVNKLGKMLRDASAAGPPDELLNELRLHLEWSLDSIAARDVNSANMVGTIRRLEDRITVLQQRGTELATRARVPELRWMPCDPEGEARLVRHSEDASGFDLHNRGWSWPHKLDEVQYGDVFIEAGRRVLFRGGIKLAIPRGYEGQVRSRSGVALREGLVTVTGTIDADYRGEIGAVVVNTSRTTTRIVHGERIAQLVICPVATPILLQVDPEQGLGYTERGEGGFGSTGR